MSVHLQFVNQRNFKFHPKSADDFYYRSECFAIKWAKPQKVSYFIMGSAASIAVFVTCQAVTSLCVYHSRLSGAKLGCPSKLVSIRNNRNRNRNQFRHYPKQNVCFGFFASVPKQRVSMFRLNQNKQKTIRNGLIGSMFCYILQKSQDFSGFFRFFCFFSVCFETVNCFGCFASIPKQRVSMFLLNRNKQKAHSNSLKESTGWQR